MTFEAELVLLGDVVRRERGSIRTGPFGTTLRASEYSDIGVPVVSVGEVGYGSFRIHKETRRVGPHVLKRLPIYRLNVGDIVFARKGAVDRCATVRDAEDGWFLGSDGIRIRLGRGSGRINPNYLGYALHASDVRRWLLRNATGTTMATLNQDLLERVPVWIPAKVEQDRIASALDDVSDLVGGLETLIAKKRDVKQGMMQELLAGRTRLPAFTGDWEVRSIGSFADVKAGGTPSTTVARYWGGSIRWMSSGEIHQKQVSEVAGRITLDGLRESSAHVFPAGTVLMALAGQGKTRGTVAVSRVELATNQSLAGILPSTEHDAYFLYYNLDTRYEELRGESAGDGGRGGLNLTIIKNLEVEMPKVDEQRAIGSVLVDVDIEIQALERRLESARAVKVGMMQELLTGRTRLPVKREA